jgi:hypothetical protein
VARCLSSCSPPGRLAKVVEAGSLTILLAILRATRARFYGERWVQLWYRVYGAAIAESQQALAGLVDKTLGYDQALVNERVPTRLGDGTVDVEVDGELLSPFTGAAIDVLSIRANWLRRAQPGSKAEVITVEAGGRTILDVGGTRFKYDLEGLNRA